MPQKHPNAFFAAVVGSGQWSAVHLAALAASPYIAGITLCGRNAAATAERAAKCPAVIRCVTHLDEVLHDPEIRLVTVALPHHLHAETSLRILAAGKHAICEKPGATRLDDLDRLLDAAGHGTGRLAIVMNQLANPLTHRLRELVDQGAIGRPFLCVENAYSRHAAWYRDASAWRTDRQLSGGGVLIDGGFHLVYRTLHVLESCGPALSVVADTPQLNVDPTGQFVPAKGEDLVSMCVSLQSGLRIQWSHAWTLAAPPTRQRQAFIAGSNGTLELTDDPQTPLQLHTPQGSQAVSVPAGPRTGPETTHAWLLDTVERFFLNRPLEASEPTLAHQALSVILAAYESSETGRREGIAARRRLE